MKIYFRFFHHKEWAYLSYSLEDISHIVRKGLDQNVKMEKRNS